MNPGISIVICTYNGAGRLRETVRHIARQQVRRTIPWELILIDNNSTDDGVSLVQDEWSSLRASVPLIIRQQPLQGLAMAREMGIRTARYEYVILCDDDNWLSPDYVNTAYDSMSQNPRIGILGARGELVYEAVPDPWLLRLNLLAGGAQAASSGKVHSHRVYGAGCVLRKSAYQLLVEVNFKFMLSDRSGAQLTSGGDHELCYILALCNYEIWYNENLRFKHYITRERLTWDYWVRYVRESSACNNVLEPYRMILNGARPTQSGFHKHLIKNFAYFFIRFLPVSFSRWIFGSRSAAGKLNYLKYILLREQLQNCLWHFAMKKNFFLISSLKKELQEKVTITDRSLSVNHQLLMVQAFSCWMLLLESFLQAQSIVVSLL